MFFCTKNWRSFFQPWWKRKTLPVLRLQELRWFLFVPLFVSHPVLFRVSYTCGFPLFVSRSTKIKNHNKLCFAIVWVQKTLICHDFPTAKDRVLPFSRKCSQWNANMRQCCHNFGPGGPIRRSLRSEPDSIYSTLHPQFTEVVWAPRRLLTERAACGCGSEWGLLFYASITHRHWTARSSSPEARCHSPWTK